MSYAETNKEAWDEAFFKHKEGYKFDIAEKLLEKGFFFLEEEALLELRSLGVEGKDVAQFCCNNGRELLSLLKLGARSGLGFDISGNFIAEARRIAGKLGMNARFIETNIYDIGDEYDNRFDLLLVTIGALCWFDDIDLFMSKASRVLRPGGVLLIHEQHPFCDMLAAEGEEEFERENPKKIALPYFRTVPWIQTDGLDYIGGTTYPSKACTSFSHTLSGILNALIGNGIGIAKFSEFDRDISAMFAHLDRQGIPLSYILVGIKSQGKH